MFIFDLHCDTLTYCIQREGWSLRSNSGHTDAVRLKNAGAAAQCFALYVPGDWSVDAWEYYKNGVEVFRRELAGCSDIMSPALCAADMEANHAVGKLSAILTVEDCAPLDGHLERLERFYDDGVRMAALTWNFENALGFPNSDSAEIMQRPLKPFGIECVERMNALGIIVDVSHLSEGGFWDVLRHSSKPFVASHSNARALCAHSRCLTDEQLRALGDSGGAVGVSFVPFFLRGDGAPGTVEDIVRHIRHIVSVAGMDAVAFGSDFDGFDGGVELRGCEDFPELVRALERVFSPAELEKLCFKNALRVFRDVCG